MTDEEPVRVKKRRRRSRRQQMARASILAPIFLLALTALLSVGMIRLVEGSSKRELRREVRASQALPEIRGVASSGSFEGRRALSPAPRSTANSARLVDASPLNGSLARPPVVGASARIARGLRTYKIPLQLDDALDLGFSEGAEGL